MAEHGSRGPRSNTWIGIRIPPLSLVHTETLSNERRRPLWLGHQPLHPHGPLPTHVMGMNAVDGRLDRRCGTISK